MIKKSFSVIIPLLVSAVVAKEKNVTCIATDHCSCKMSNSGKLVSLWDINDPNKARFQNYKMEGKQLYFDYSPCTPFSEGDQKQAEDDCEQDLICQHDLHLKNVKSAGRANELSVHYNSNSSRVSFTYQGGRKQGGIARQTTVRLVCDPTSKYPKITAPIEDSSKAGYYSFNLTTVCACPGYCKARDDSPGYRKTVSVGTILVILFFVTLFVYFVGGFLYLKYYKHEEGTHAVPHYEFWKDFPAKVKDGFKFMGEVFKDKHGEYQEI